VNLDPSAFLADPELLDALEKQSTSIPSSEDHVLFRQGDAPTGLFILNKGEVSLTMTSATGETVMSVQAGAGSLLGLPGLIGNEPYTLTAIAHGGAELRFVTREDFTGMMGANPRLSLKALQVLAAELRSARHALLAL
jgi:CRP-like cAMP-binding protein